MKKMIKLCWGYFSEWVLAILLVALCSKILGADEFIRIVKGLADELASLVFVVLFSGSIAFIWALFTKVDSAFYIWLDGKGALTVYFNAMYYVFVVEFLGVVSAIAIKMTSGCVSLVLTVMMGMAIINGFTMVSNAVDLMRLNLQFMRSRARS